MNFKRFVCMLLVVLTVAAMLPTTVFASSSSVSVSASNAAAPALSKTGVRLIAKKAFTLKVNNYKGKVTWSSSNKAVATVSSTGAVKGIKAGTAIISAKLANGKVLKCKVVVVNAVSFTYKNAVYKTLDGTTCYWEPIYFVNNTTKTVKTVYLRMKEYDAKGNVVASSTTWKWPMLINPKSKLLTYSQLMKKTNTIKYTLAKVTFTDGTTWTP